MRSEGIVCALLLLSTAACGPSEAESSPTPRATATGVPSPTPSPTACPGGTAILPGGKATLSFVERLEAIPIEHTGVMTTQGEAVRGTYLLRPSGEFESCSSVLVELRGLQSQDNPFLGISLPDFNSNGGGHSPETSHRDDTAQGALETRHPPDAIFRPHSISGLAPGQGTSNVIVAGALTLKGVTRDGEWRGTVTRSGGETRVDLKTTIKWSDFELDIPTPPYIIRLEDHATVEIAFSVRE